jgi:hypothetical protein
MRTTGSSTSAASSLRSATSTDSTLRGVWLPSRAPSIAVTEGVRPCITPRAQPSPWCSLTACLLAHPTRPASVFGVEYCDSRAQFGGDSQVGAYCMGGTPGATSRTPCRNTQLSLSLSNTQRAACAQRLRLSRQPAAPPARPPLPATPVHRAARGPRACARWPTPTWAARRECDCRGWSRRWDWPFIRGKA